MKYKDPTRSGSGPYEQEAVAALDFLAAQRQVDQARLAVFGHSEGGIYALLLASGLAGPAPPGPRGRTARARPHPHARPA
jgi:uncharacterized protein